MRAFGVLKIVQKHPPRSRQVCREYAHRTGLTTDFVGFQLKLRSLFLAVLVRIRFLSFFFKNWNRNKKLQIQKKCNRILSKPETERVRIDVDTVTKIYQNEKPLKLSSNFIKYITKHNQLRC